MLNTTRVRVRANTTNLPIRTVLDMYAHMRAYPINHRDLTERRATGLTRLIVPVEIVEEVRTHRPTPRTWRPFGKHILPDAIIPAGIMEKLERDKLNKKPATPQTRPTKQIGGIFGVTFDSLESLGCNAFRGRLIAPPPPNTVPPWLLLYHDRKVMMQEWADYLDKLKAGAEVIPITGRWL